MNIFTNDLERKHFLSLLKSSKKKFDFDLYAYALMSNHYHLLIKPKDACLSKIMQRINSLYGQFFNWRHNRVGHVYQGRYNNIVVEDSDYLFDVVRYIHRNPVKKKKLKDADDYRWTSHPEYMNSSVSELTDTEFLLGLIDKDRKKAVDEFGRFIDGAVYKTSYARFAGYLNSLVAGGREFTRNLVKTSLTNKLKIPAWAFRGNWASPEDIILKVMNLFDVNRDEIIVKKGKWNRAKKAAIYMMHKNTTLTAPEIAGIFNKQHPSGIRRIVESVEIEMKDNTDYKNLIDALNNSLLKTGV